MEPMYITLSQHFEPCYFISKPCPVSSNSHLSLPKSILTKGLFLVSKEFHLKVFRCSFYHYIHMMQYYCCVHLVDSAVLLLPLAQYRVCHSDKWLVTLSEECFINC